MPLATPSLQLLGIEKKKVRDRERKNKIIYAFNIYKKYYFQTNVVILEYLSRMLKWAFLIAYCPLSAVRKFEN